MYKSAVKLKERPCLTASGMVLQKRKYFKIVIKRISYHSLAIYNVLLFHIIFTTILWGKHYTSHFVDKEAEVKRNKLTWSMPHELTRYRAVIWTHIWFSPTTLFFFFSSPSLDSPGRLACRSQPCALVTVQSALRAPHPHHRPSELLHLDSPRPLRLRFSSPTTLNHCTL